MHLRLAMITVLAATALAGCSDHRVEDVCDKICSCSTFGEQALAECNLACVAELTPEDPDDEQAGISDVCVGCIEQADCSAIEFSCSSVCEIDDSQGEIDVSN